MREIKFRAWDKQYNIVGDVIGLWFFGGRIKVDFIGNNEKPKTVDNKNIFLMQFTGERDTTRSEQFPEGQKIYTDDIVKVKDHIGLVYFDEEYLGFFIRYSDADGELCMCPLYDNEVKLLGNKYQNPELWGARNK